MVLGPPQLAASFIMSNRRRDVSQLALSGHAGGFGSSAHCPGNYFRDAESDPRVIDELTIPDNQRLK
jgi:hypothetical protein